MLNMQSRGKQLVDLSLKLSACSSKSSAESDCTDADTESSIDYDDDDMDKDYVPPRKYDSSTSGDELDADPARCKVSKSLKRKNIEVTASGLVETDNQVQANTGLETNHQDEGADERQTVSGAEMETDEVEISTERDTQPQTEQEKANKDEGTINKNRKRSRKGQGDRNSWTRNKQKEKRMKGEAFKGLRKTVNGKYVQDVHKTERNLGPTCTKKSCRKVGGVRHCSMFSEDERQTIFSYFWKNLGWDQRRNYVSTLVFKTDPDRRNAESRKQVSFVYHLRKDDKTYRVCKEMFLSTLSIGEWSVRNWVLKATMGMQPRSPPTVVVTSEKRTKLREFIRSLPTVPSHYCRSSSSKMYLEPNIRSFSDLYNVYLEWSAQHHCETLSHQVLRHECQELNIGLYQPKKDQCDTCLGHEAGNISDDEFSLHMKRKEAARMEKTADKERAERNSVEIPGPGHHVLTMDLQSLLLAPMLNASCMYYRTKLCCHNFTVYNCSTRDVVCYFWHEGQGELVAHVFASCVTDFIQNIATGGDTVILYSDGCTYQNRNATLSNALIHLAVDKGITIEQKYLEKGHTQMEVDSVHSVIERSLRHRSIYIPADYVEVIKRARKHVPYKVKYLSYDFFKDFAKICYYQSIRPGNKVGDPHVTDIKALKYSPEGDLYFKLDFSDNWRELPRRSRRDQNPPHPTPLYTEPRKIKTAKYKHLQELKSVIPKDYHSFYDNLPCESSVVE